MPSKLTPWKELRILKHQIPAHGSIPNTSIQHKPLLLYKSLFPDNTSASQIESHLSSIGVVQPQWRYTMYDFSHFHSTSHEVLGISHGRARLCFGHEDNPDRVVEEVCKGDVIVIPAGVSHCLLEDLEGGFQMVGCYPKGYNWDVCEAGDDRKVQMIESLEWFEKDPVYGNEGPVLEV
ncbi:uncharacterized protein RCC_09255 [Ramularia collo-cygni]|uniref:Cupin type-1 domain-containing protein n=1 Tax=Ramularia collo-cygni TaxID=112498 RepID=A0A2D3VH84_9PEZI|nr:uncharacterized protein RCC_09255 [Ramularia collo-cygni]CZT23541.1 uncharacterized protein RCC_09255 [Ramularia collo-cygni]